MKKFLLIGICLVFIQIVKAQNKLLALDEHNKYVYYQVVDMPGFTADSLNKNVQYFVKTVYPKVTINTESATGNIDLSDKFHTYNPMALVKHESGEISYKLHIECKDAKYRYWLTDFVFTPYQTDRYGAFVPKPGIHIPLETAASALDKKELKGYMDQIEIFSKQMSIKLKKYILEGDQPKKVDAQPVKKVVTDKW